MGWFNRRPKLDPVVIPIPDKCEFKPLYLLPLLLIPLWFLKGFIPKMPTLPSAPRPGPEEEPTFDMGPLNMKMSLKAKKFSKVEKEELMATFEEMKDQHRQRLEDLNNQKPMGDTYLIDEGGGSKSITQAQMDEMKANAQREIDMTKEEYMADEKRNMKGKSNG